MRMTFWLCAIIGVGVWTPQRGFAAEASTLPRLTQPSQNSAKPTAARFPEAGLHPQARAAADQSPGKSPEAEGERTRVSGKRAQSSGTKTSAKGRPGPKLPEPSKVQGEPLGEGRTADTANKAIPDHAAPLRRPGVNAAPAGAKAGSMLNAMDTQPRLPVHGLTSPLQNTQLVQRRSPGPAILGGPAISNLRDTAAINGTGMRRIR